MNTERGGAPHAALANFPIQNGEFVVGATPLSELAARVGSTPFYAYDRRLLDARVAALRGTLPREVRLHYAMKANPMPEIVAHLAHQVDGIDVASAGELRVALECGARPDAISFAGPGKTERELAIALESGIVVNVESFREIAFLAQASDRLGRNARVAIRVNPDFELKSSGMRMGGGPKPFGIDAEDVPRALDLVRASGLDFEGFHVFAGSQNLHADAICEAQTNAYHLVRRLAEHAPSPVRTLNLGGGFGIPYFPGEQPLDVEAIGRHLAELVREAAVDLPGTALVLELGRYIVGEAGVYVCRIVDRKVSRGHVFLVTDGGLHHHLAASGNFGQVIRKNYPVAIGNRAGAAAEECVSIVGPLCTPLDLLAERVMLPTADVGDLVVVFQSGAYGATASPQRFLSHPPPSEILV